MSLSGLIVGKFAPLHAGHQFLIETALRRCDILTILAYSNPDFPDMPQTVRAAWLRHLYPQARVLTPEAPPPDASSDDVHRRFVKAYLNAAKIAVDTVFTSERYGEGFAAVLGAEHHAVDMERRRYAISGRNVRTAMRENAAFLPEIVRWYFGL